jgi:hypothetical protein
MTFRFCQKLGAVLGIIIKWLLLDELFRLIQAALSDALNYLKSGRGNVAIFDATNTTRERRHIVYERIVKENRLKCMFLGMNKIIKLEISFVFYCYYFILKFLTLEFN